MEERFSMGDLEKINEEISKYPKGRREQFAGNSYTYRDVDLDFVVDFLNGIEYDKYIFSGTEYIYQFERERLESLTYEKHHQFRIDCSPVIDKGGQVININMDRFEIISKHKRLDLYLGNGIYLGETNISMLQITPDGLYSFRLVGYGMPNGEIQYRYDLEFHPVQPGYEEKFLDTNLAEKRWMYFSDGKNKVANYVPISIAKENLPKLANKIYRNGLPSLRETLMNGGKLELTEEDREYYELTSEEKEKLQIIQNSQVSEEKKESDILHSTNGEEPVQNEKETTTELDDFSNEERKAIVEHLIVLKDLGVELTDKQKSMIELYERLNSDKFKKYKENKEERTRRQQEIREQVKAESERVYQWNNSPEHPANIRKEQRIEQLKQLRTQLDAMENLKNVAPDLLTPQQLKLLQTGYVFLEMIEKSNSEVHEVDTGMSPEMRIWYQNYYANEESKSRK